jgi:hemolysin activation/secretion protein
LGDGKAFRKVSLQPGTTGNYIIVTGSLSREQKNEDGWSCLMRADGQWANEPLISNEQFGLGGEAGVRGYPEGATYGDTGWRATLEPRTPQFELGLVDGTEPMQARLYALFDYGERYLLGANTQQPRRARLAGTGAGISATIGDNLDMRLQVAFALLDIPFATEQVYSGDMRISFSLGARF